MNKITNSIQNQETYKEIKKIFQRKSVKNNIILTGQKILDILSLVPNISEIEGEKIFIKWKKKHGGTLDIEKFLEK